MPDRRGSPELRQSAAHLIRPPGDARREPIDIAIQVMDELASHQLPITLLRLISQPLPHLGQPRQTGIVSAPELFGEAEAVVDRRQRHARQHTDGESHQHRP